MDGRKEVKETQRPALLNMKPSTWRKIR